MLPSGTVLEESTVPLFWNDCAISTGFFNLIDSDYTGDKMGALIYPMVSNDLSKGRLIPIQGSNIMVKTINLNTDWKNIEADLLEFVRKFELGYSRRKNS